MSAIQLMGFPALCFVSKWLSPQRKKNIFTYYRIYKLAQANSGTCPVQERHLPSAVYMNQEKVNTASDCLQVKRISCLFASVT